MNNPFRRLRSRVAYDSPTFRVREDVVQRPNGSESPFPVIEMKSGASVLAVTDNDEVYLVREFKYAVDRPSLEVISGGIEDEEQPLDAAQRELEEEAGLTASDWHDCGTVDPFTTMLAGPVYLFVARGLSPTKRHPDQGEVLQTEKVPLREAIRRVEAGEITHAPTCVLLYREWTRRSQADRAG